MRADPEFQYIEAAFSYRKSRRDITEISLNESNRRAEQSKSKAFWLDLTNKKRIAQGLEPLASLDELNSETPPELSALESVDSSLDETGEDDITPDLLAAPQPVEQQRPEDPQKPQPDQSSTATEFAELDDETPDAYLVEAANILSDFIGMTQKSQSTNQSLTAT